MLGAFLERVRSRWAVQSDRAPVAAVDSEGLTNLLDDSGVRRKFERGDMACKFCGTPVREANVYALIRDSGSLKAVCSQAACVSQLVAWIEGS
jgi:hypothetical protein